MGVVDSQLSVKIFIISQQSFNLRTTLFVYKFQVNRGRMFTELRSSEAKILNLFFLMGNAVFLYNGNSDAQHSGGRPHGLTPTPNVIQGIS